MVDSAAIVDRRQLRRKLGFWRVATVVLLIALGFGVYFIFADDFKKAGPQIARVEVSGLITDNSELLERLEKISKDSNVKALVVSISSPGGTTYGGERLYQAIRAVAAKKPVVSDVRTLAASAAYMTAIAGDRIIAGDTSITGSIGVIFQYPQAKGLLDKLGVSMEEIKSAPMKAEPSPFHPPPEEAKTMINNMIMDSFDWFVALVAERRHFSHEDALKLADGSIYTGRQALKLKLVDEIGGEDAIRNYLKTRNVDSKLPLVDWEAPRRSSIFATAIGGVFRLLGYGDLVTGANLDEFANKKLFLDGLLSVWQGADH